MKLYYKSGACSLASHIALCESGLAYELESVDLATKKTEHGHDFFKINPKGQVPTLVLDDGSLLTEGVAIMQFIADKAPEKKLVPAFGTLERYHAIEWLNFIATELHKGFGPLFYPGTPEDMKTVAKNRLDAKFQYIDSVLAKQPYLLGEQFSIVDGYLFTVLNWTNFLKIDISAYTNINAFMNRMTQRPLVQKAMKEEGMI